MGWTCKHLLWGRHCNKLCSIRCTRCALAISAPTDHHIIALLKSISRTITRSLVRGQSPLSISLVWLARYKSNQSDRPVFCSLLYLSTIKLTMRFKVNSQGDGDVVLTDTKRGYRAFGDGQQSYSNCAFSQSKTHSVWKPGWQRLSHGLFYKPEVPQNQSKPWVSDN